MKLRGTSRWSVEAALSGLAALRWRPGRWAVSVDDEGWVRGRAWRGFPIGAVGQGGLSLDTDGGFSWLFAQGNWMAPIEELQGLSLEVTTTPGEVGGRAPRAWPLRRRRWGHAGFADVSLRGMRPTCTQRFADDQAVVTVEVEGWSALVPHDERASVAPALTLTVALSSRLDTTVEAVVRMRCDPPIGAGGIGHTGVITDEKGRMTGLGGRLEWPAVATTAHASTIERVDGARPLLTVAPADPSPEGARRSAHGAWHLLADHLPGAGSGCARVDPAQRTVEVALELGPGGRATARFVLGWWFPHHVVDARPARHRGTRRADPGGSAASTSIVDVGRRAGAYFADAEALLSFVLDEEPALRARADAPRRLLEQSDLPGWAVRAILNSALPVVANSVLPRDGTLSTIEGSGWRWWFGGLVGTCDQRLVSHPYTATFFPSLDRSELELFARLADGGSVPHGTGNCDLALGDDRVPYGRPLTVAGVLRDEPWPDLTLSWILQACRLARATGDRAWLAASAPRLIEMLQFLQTLRGEEGVPVGGSSFDTLHFPGTFVYTAGLYRVALDALRGVVALLRDGSEAEQRVARTLHDAVAHAARSERATERLWDARGFFRSTPTRETLMVGAMAGPWVARWSGLPLPWAGERVRAHLLLQHRALFGRPLAPSRRAAFPTSEVDPDGTAVVARALGALPVFGYAWQVLAYHALACVQAGLVAEGLEVLRAFDAHLHRRGVPFSADLYGHGGGALYMSQTIWWALPQALTGAFLDVLTGTLTLSPRLLPGQRRARWPLFLTTTWGLVEVDGVHQRATVTVTHAHGPPPTVTQLRVVGPEGTERLQPLSPPIVLEEGASVTFPFHGAR